MAALLQWGTDNLWQGQTQSLTRLLFPGDSKNHRQEEMRGQLESFLQSPNLNLAADRFGSLWIMLQQTRAHKERLFQNPIKPCSDLCQKHWRTSPSEFLSFNCGYSPWQCKAYFFCLFVCFLILQSSQSQMVFCSSTIFAVCSSYEVHSKFQPSYMLPTNFRHSWRTWVQYIYWFFLFLSFIFSCCLLIGT